MRPDSWMVAALVGSLLLVGCPKRGIESNGCMRDVKGDLATIQKRLEKDRPEEAHLYVVGLAPCGDAQNSVEYHNLAALVAEELGDLNAAWAANVRGRDVAKLAEDETSGSAFQTALDRFKAEYVWLQLEGVSDRAASVSYAGAVVDDATMRQIEAINQNVPVRDLESHMGFWVYPGKYKIGGALVSLEPGAVHALRPGTGAGP